MPRKAKSNTLLPAAQRVRSAVRSYDSRTGGSRNGDPIPVDGDVVSLVVDVDDDRLTLEERRVAAQMYHQAVWDQMSAAVDEDGDAAEYERLEPLYDALEELRHSVDRRGVVAPADFGGLGSSTRQYVADRPLAKDQTMRGAVQAFGWDQDSRDLSHSRDENGRELSFQAVIRNGLNDGVIRNAMGGGSPSTGGYLVPTILSAEIIDLARAKARVLQAGARIVPMTNRVVDVPKWAADPAAEWRGENEAIPEDDAELGVVTLTAKSLAVITRVSRELVEDTALASELTEAFAASFATAFDLASLYGPSGADGPVGLKNLVSITKTPLGVDGEAPSWDDLVDSVGRLRDLNEEPTGQIMSDRTLRTLAKLKETGTGAYVQAPAYLDDVARYGTNQVPNDLTVGTSDDTSDVFTGDWSQLLLGVRTDVTITTLTERYADSGQVAFVCWFRGDVQPARPAAFDIVTGVRP